MLKSTTPDKSAIDTIKKYHDVIFLILAGILFFSFTLSKALISISFSAICALGLLYLKDSAGSNQERFLIIVFVSFYILTGLTYFNSENEPEALRKMFLKLPLILFPLAFFSFKQLSQKSIFNLGLLINYAIYLPAVISVYNYMTNKELFDDLILQSKPLPIEFGYGILHINFSILLACVILFGVFQLYRQFKNSQLGLPFYTLLTLVVMNFIFIHILSARTGLVGLYAGLAVFCICLFSFLPFRKSRWGLAAIVLTPILLIGVSTSLQHRIRNTVADLNVVLHQKNANDYSFAMRVKAWGNAWDVIKNNKWLGVGIGDAEEVLKNNFANFDPGILPENRKNPHFQLIETAVQSGMICAFMYLLIFFAGFIKTDGKFNFPLLAFMALLFVVSCFESILESQVSVAAFVFFIALAANPNDARNN